MRKLIIALALLGILVLAGCTQPTGTGGGGAAASANITAGDLGALDNPDSESLDTGIPLEDI